MQKRRELTAATLLVFALAGAASAQAEPTPSPTATADAYKTPLEQYKLNRDEYQQALKDRDSRMRVINATFKNSTALRRAAHVEVFCSGVIAFAIAARASAFALSTEFLKIVLITRIRKSRSLTA